MHPKFEKKNSHCQQEALKSLQSIFPSLNMSEFSKKSSVWEVLQRSTQTLPRPSLSDITNAISNMKTIVDSQELKIQKNMIQIQEYQENIEKRHCYSQQPKTNSKSISVDQKIYCRKSLSFDNAMLSEMQGQQENQDYGYSAENYQAFHQGRKNQFFSEPEQIDYLQSPLQNRSNFDEDDEVKKYLSFDF